MRLFEFDITDPVATNLAVAIDQLKHDIDSGKYNPEWSVDQLLRYFEKLGVQIDRTDLYSMIKTPPLKDVVANIKGDKVVFRGHESMPPAQPDENQKIVKQMAQSALAK